MSGVKKAAAHRAGGAARGLSAVRGRGARPRIEATQADRDLAERLAAWFGRAARTELPWRDGPAGARDPYRVLVSEAMLQQTQVSRVLERFPRFMARFPDVRALAAADEHAVLAEWSGMGYYRRARNLHAAAKMIVEEFGGRVPREVESLRRLPGVGRYTAGAIASMAYNEAAPIVDGNVARVLLRIHGRDAASDDRKVQAWLWERAEALAAASDRPGVVNEALMELGATVCVPGPALPRCQACPLNASCAAKREGRQAEIPRPKARARQKNLYCGVVVARRSDGAILMEQRPGKGMWAGLWQAPTLESAERPVSAGEVAAAIGVRAGLLRPESNFEHQTTHRRVLFCVWRAEVDERAAAGISRGLWMTAAKAAGLGLSNAQRRILADALGGGTLWA